MVNRCTVSRFTFNPYPVRSALKSAALIYKVH